MSRLNRAVITILGLGGIGFGLVGYGVRTFLTPSVVVVIDQSYCPPDQWAAVVSRYQSLYQQNQRHQIQIEQVIVFNSLSQTPLDPLPSPDQIAAINTFGRAAPEREASLRASYGNAEFLRCGD